jgi:hypothetical protein
MSTIKYEGVVPDEDLLNAAVFHGWQAETVKKDANGDPEKDANGNDVMEPNPETYQKFATLRVLGRAFMNVTAHESCIPKKEDLSPKAYNELQATKTNAILSTSKVYLNNTQIHP